MNSSIELLRPEIRHLRPYRAADYLSNSIRLNANEAPWRPPNDETLAGLNRYPDVRPVRLAEQLASLYGVQTNELLVTRGSSEAIDLLLRGFCRAGQDSITICPPTFGMYELYAQIQGAGIRSLPLDRDAGFQLPTDELLQSWSPTDKLLFVCSPNNPTGNTIPDSAIERLCLALAGRGVVVLDAAYQEFAATDTSTALLHKHDNLVVLRTLSKAMSLAGVRCGVLLGNSALLELLGRVLPPYTFPTVSQEAVLRLLTPAAQDEFKRRRTLIVDERERLFRELQKLSAIKKVWPSAANFLLVEAHDADDMLARTRKAQILLRDFSWDPLLAGCIRITVGAPDENDKLLTALNS